MKDKKIKCKCCGKKIVKFSYNTKYCSACAIYYKELLQKLNYYRRMVRELKIKLYGCPDGRERLR